MQTVTPFRGRGRGLRDAHGGEQGAVVRIELSAREIATLDVLPRQIARLVDPVTSSEWVVDARRCGAQVQVRAVEYASDGLWMPHVWRDVPEGASVHFIEGRGLEVRTPAKVRAFGD